jgi:hypothetical protein
MWAISASMHLDHLIHGLDAIFAVAGGVEKRLGRMVWIIACPAVWSCPVLVERFLDLDPRRLKEITKGRFFLAWIYRVESLLPDDLSDQFCRMRHYLIAKLDLGTPGPDILG